MNDKTQGHDQDEDHEETDSQADQDFAEALVFNRIKTVDAEQYDGKNNSNRQHTRV